MVYCASWHSQGRSGESHERRGHSPDRTAGRISHTGTPETRQWEQGYDTHTNITHQHHTNITHTTHTNIIQISHTHTPQRHTNIAHQHYTTITHTTHKTTHMTQIPLTHHIQRDAHILPYTYTYHTSTHTCKQKVCLCLICGCLPVGPESPTDTHSSICSQRQSNVLKETVTEHKDNQSPKDRFQE